MCCRGIHTQRIYTKYTIAYIVLLFYLYQPFRCKMVHFIFLVFLCDRTVKDYFTMWENRKQYKDDDDSGDDNDVMRMDLTLQLPT